MIEFGGIIERMEEQGEKKGWYYIFLPETVAQQIKPGNRKFFRVRGEINGHHFAGLAVTPVGEGDFILPVNANIRKTVKVGIGDMLHLRVEEDTDYEVTMPEDLEICLAEEPRWLETFLRFNKANRNYFIKWINEAKTEATRTKRIAMTVEAMDLGGLDFGAMIRRDKARRRGEEWQG